MNGPPGSRPPKAGAAASPADWPYLPATASNTGWHSKARLVHGAAPKPRFVLFLKCLLCQLPLWFYLYLKIYPNRRLIPNSLWFRCLL
jgi:hypothetical protein